MHPDGAMQSVSKFIHVHRESEPVRVGLFIISLVRKHASIHPISKGERQQLAKCLCAATVQKAR